MANKFHKDITGRTVLINKYYLHDTFHREVDRSFLCESGLGCLPYSTGTKIYGIFLADHKEATIKSSWIEELLEE